MNLRAHFHDSIQIWQDNPVVVRRDSTIADVKLVPPIDYARLVVALEIQIGGAWSEEGGALRWTRADWAKDTRLPYRLSQRTTQSRWIARDRLKRWAEYLRRMDVEATATILAMAWERGLTQAMRRTKDERPTAFAIEVTKLYGNLGR